MKNKYHLEYEETEQTLTDMYQLYHLNRSAYIYKTIIFFVGLLVLLIVTVGQKEFSFNADGILLLVKGLIIWALFFVAGYLINKYVMRSVNLNAAKKKGKADYEKRAQIFEGDMKVKINCADEKIFVSIRDKKEAYSYRRITKIFETDSLFAVIVNIAQGDIQMVCFPKSALESNAVEGFREFLTNKCIYVRKIRRL